MSEKLPEGWKRVKLGEIAIFGNGKVRPKTKGNIPIYGGNGILGYCDKFNYYGETIIIGRVGAYCGSVFYENRPIWISDNALSAKPKGKNNSKYLYYLLKNLDLNQFALGSSHPLITQTLLNSIDVLITTCENEQKAIASVLSSLDDKIDLLHRQNQTLEQMAQTLFRKWFIEDAKEDWKEVKLKDIYIFEKGFEPGSKNYLEEREHNTIRFIRVGDLLDNKGNTFIKKDIAKVMCKKEDLLMSFDGTVGRINFGLEGAFSSGIRKIYSKNPVFNNLGLKYLIFKSKDIQDLIKSHSSGTVILHASSSIDYLTFSFPRDKNYIEDFNKLINPIFYKILKNKHQIRTLENLRDTLLPKLMKGEIRVKKIREDKKWKLIQEVLNGENGICKFNLLKISGSRT